MRTSKNPGLKGASALSGGSQARVETVHNAGRVAGYQSDKEASGQDPGQGQPGDSSGQEHSSTQVAGGRTTSSVQYQQLSPQNGSVLPMSIMPVSSAGTAEDRFPNAIFASTQDDPGESSIRAGTAPEKPVSDQLLPAVSTASADILVGPSPASSTATPQLGDQHTSPATGLQTTASISGSPRLELPTLTHAGMVRSMNGSQVQVSLRSEDFGKVTVHAGYARDTLSAQITLESSPLGAALSTHVTGLEQKLAGEHGIRTSIQISTGGETGSESRQQGTDPQRNRREEPARLHPFGTATPTAGVAEASDRMESRSIRDNLQASPGRLNITI